MLKATLEKINRLCDAIHFGGKKMEGEESE
jgi:hypothetical protein